MKRIYETIVIFDTSLDDPAIDQKIQRIESSIKSIEGEISKTEKWGKRKLAYEIKKRREGNYVYIQSAGDINIIEQLDNLFRYDESVLKTLTVNVEQVNKSRYGPKKSSKKTKSIDSTVSSSLPIEEGITNG